MREEDGWIDNVEFPAKKLDLIDTADAAGVSQKTLERLQRLGREQYESRGELEAELENGR